MASIWHLAEFTDNQVGESVEGLASCWHCEMTQAFENSAARDLYGQSWIVPSFIESLQEMKWLKKCLECQWRKLRSELATFWPISLFLLSYHFSALSCSHISDGTLGKNMASRAPWHFTDTHPDSLNCKLHGLGNIMRTNCIENIIRIHLIVRASLEVDIYINCIL